MIIDYGSGNVRSVAKACERVMQDYAIKGQVSLCREAKKLAQASHVILPGVGAFADCMQGLGGLEGEHVAALTRHKEQGKAFLGICVGMQLLATRGIEFGEHKGLGWLQGEVCPFDVDDSLKIPHMGWNTLSWTATQAQAHPIHPIAEDIADKKDEEADVYFVHSYHFCCTRSEEVLAHSTYGRPFPAVMARDNVVGTQFHPEKSQQVGLRLLRNFIRWRV
ncbi:MAG: imidazole glycerol phosphate synthase subunit HisH [Alphaproteobacteria bacterium GM202ARS2]|nr:imidazole glycerol phosphate synthase subunit HisH [Alphaproteobacteria bacterium GM202ARS2]